MGFPHFFSLEYNKVIFWNFKEITLPLRQPSVWLIQICDVPRIDKSISKIPTEDIKITKINEEASIVSWSDRTLKTKCIEYYKVDFFDGEESERFLILFFIIKVIIFSKKYISTLALDISNFFRLLEHILQVNFIDT